LDVVKLAWSESGLELLGYWGTVAHPVAVHFLEKLLQASVIEGHCDFLAAKERR
jgi:hypothetical protein